MLNYSQIEQEIKSKVLEMAKESPLDWFIDFHLKEVVLAAEDLLKEYPEASREVVILASWLHDLGHLRAKTLEEVDLVKPDHHIVGAKMAEDELAHYNLAPEILEKIKKCVLRHRARPDYQPETIEEKIVAVADTLSHFHSIFYLVYFKVYPTETLKEFVVKQKEKLDRDWRDLAILPKAQDLARNRYETIFQMLEDFTKGQNE